MRRPPEVPAALLDLLGRQDGAVTNAQALASGLSRNEVRTLVIRGWTRPVRGVLVAPDPPDPFRTSVRAALLARPDAVVSGVSAARLHKLQGLPQWRPAELPHLLIPAGFTYDERAGVRLRSGLHPAGATRRAGFPVTTLDSTVGAMTLVLPLDDLICLVDSALRQRWAPVLKPRSGKRKLLRALTMADGRSESAFETRLRLLFVRAGIPPEILQFRVYTEAGREIARLDMAWPSVKLAVEADGRETHDALPALYRDRVRANDLELEGWMILRFTWFDLVSRPEWVLNQVHRALNRLPVVMRAS
jgi:very-short-patch-repair endonuclease